MSRATTIAVALFLAACVPVESNEEIRRQAMESEPCECQPGRTMNSTERALFQDAVQGFGQMSWCSGAASFWQSREPMVYPSGTQSGCFELGSGNINVRADQFNNIRDLANTIAHEYKHIELGHHNMSQQECDEASHNMADEVYDYGNQCGWHDEIWFDMGYCTINAPCNGGATGNTKGSNADGGSPPPSGDGGGTAEPGTVEYDPDAFPDSGPPGECFGCPRPGMMVTYSECTGQCGGWWDATGPETICWTSCGMN